MLTFAVRLLLLSAACALAVAQPNHAPQPVPFTDTIPAARDVPYPGTLTLAVDVTDLDRRIFRVRETMPVAGPGPLVLLYPKWLPGRHRPHGPIRNLAGLQIRAAGQPLVWRRDPVDVYAFHLDVPAGVDALELEFQFLAPTADDQGRIVTTPEMLNLQWEVAALYPAGYFTRQIPVAATVTLPAGWEAATALRPTGRDGGTVRYETVPFDVLVDSPIFAGAHHRFVELAPDVQLNILADAPAQLAATDEQLAKHRELVRQTTALFGGRHYDHYDFLLALSDHLGGIGLEHQRSSENGVDPDYFLDWSGSVSDRDLLAHEFVHSWNGKYRRPADLWTPDFRTPMRDTLLWVYEGQTQFWGYVLAARSGLMSKEEVLASLASTAAYFDNLPGREWRPLEDTTLDPVIALRQPKGWPTWQRSEDYYSEGLLVWLEVDAILRAETDGSRSLDDFARAFFGVNDGDSGQLTYTFDDVVATLDGIVPHDWAAMLRNRLSRIGEHSPLSGLTGNGYQLVYRDTPNVIHKDDESGNQRSRLDYSGGFVVANSGRITRVVWNSPAFAAGLTVDTEIIAIDGRAYRASDLKDRLRAGQSPIALLVKKDDRYRTVELHYDGGLRYPHLERVGNGEVGLDRLLAPRP